MADLAPVGEDEDGERYPQLLRTRRARWWHPVLGLLLAGALLVVAGVGLAAAAFVLSILTGQSQDSVTEEISRPGSVLGLLANNILIALLIPASALAVLAVHRERVGWLASVTGRLRWGVLLRLLAIAFGVVAIYFLAGFLLPGVGGDTFESPATATVLALLGVILLTTPLQAAAEEVGFRGYLSQALASWFRGPVIGTVFAAVGSAVLFALAHGIQDRWLFGDRLAFGLVASWLAWRTGGLEAPIALHVANNMVSLTYASVTGSLEATLLASTLSWELAVLDVAMMATFTAAVECVRRRRPVAVRRAASLAGSEGVGYPGPRPSTPPPAGGENPWGMG